MPEKIYNSDTSHTTTFWSLILYSEKTGSPVMMSHIIHPNE